MVGDTLKLLEGTGAEAPRYYLLTPLPGGQNLYVFSQSNTSITANIIPEGLAKDVATGSGQYRQALALPVGDSDVPAIGFGTQVQLRRATPTRCTWSTTSPPCSDLWTSSTGCSGSAAHCCCSWSAASSGC